MDIILRGRGGGGLFSCKFLGVGRRRWKREPGRIAWCMHTCDILKTFVFM